MWGRAVILGTGLLTVVMVMVVSPRLWALIIALAKLLRGVISISVVSRTWVWVKALRNSTPAGWEDERLSWARRSRAGLGLGLEGWGCGAVAGLVAQGLAPVAPDWCCRGAGGLLWGWCLGLGLGWGWDRAIAPGTGLDWGLGLGLGLGQGLRQGLRQGLCCGRG